MESRSEAAARPLAVSGRRRALLATIPLIALPATACGECGWGAKTCDDFGCSIAETIVAVGDTKSFTVPFCEPWDDPKAVYTFEVPDTTVVTVALDQHDLILTGKSSGKTTVNVYAALEGRDGHGLLMVGIEVYEP